MHRRSYQRPVLRWDGCFYLGPGTDRRMVGCFTMKVAQRLCGSPARTATRRPMGSRCGNAAVRVGCNRLLGGAEPRKLRHRIARDVRSGRHYCLKQSTRRLSMSSDPQT
jgi:hypothetical protein